MTDATARADQELLKRIFTSDSPLTVFVNPDGSYNVMYHKTVQCHKYLRCGRQALFINVDKRVTPEQKKAMKRELSFFNGTVRPPGILPNTINKP